MLANRHGYRAGRYFVGARQEAVAIFIEEFLERTVGLHAVQNHFDGMSDLGIAKRQRFNVRLRAAEGDPKEIGKGHDPAISPDGKTVAFVATGQVWSAPVDGSAKAAQLIHASGHGPGNPGAKPPSEPAPDL